MKHPNRRSLLILTSLKWLALALLAIPVAGSGIGKLAGVPALHDPFALMGFPGWLGYFVGVVEVAGAVGVLIPTVSALAALLLVPVLAGALAFHLLWEVPSPIPALIYPAICVVAVRAHSVRSIWWWGRTGRPTPDASTPDASTPDASTPDASTLDAPPGTDVTK